jgi:hypothetical protein
MNLVDLFSKHTSKVDVSMEWKGRCMPENFLYEIGHVEYF